jgi:hypothetical protein
MRSLCATAGRLYTVPSVRARNDLPSADPDTLVVPRAGEMLFRLW